ncbi:hypothetical protein FO519_002151 [Halicephalobus sp. NKZ332]|nr:hypothetical protein FO519_002151 [Halicephalobus sp. NKZ332]
MEEKPRTLQLKRWQIISLALLVLAAIGLIICSVIYFKLDSIIEKNIRSQSYLEPGTVLYEKWTNPKYNMETRIWIYSVKNPDHILNNSKPILKTTGPYVFDQVHRRKVNEFVNSTLSYETISVYNFNENKSCPECFLYNRVWIPNMVYQKFIEAASRPAIKAATAALLVQTPFLEVEVSELLFDGYIDPFLDQVCGLPFVDFVCESLLDLPERIGFFWGKNTSSSGTFVVKSGRENENEIGSIMSWNGQDKLSKNWWRSEKAREVRGTDGSIVHPYIRKDENLTVFVKDLCRSVDLVFKEEVDYKGITAYRYIFPASGLDSSLEENQGYCNDNNKTFYEGQPKRCLPNGLLDLSRCQKGEPPVVFSLPNFLYAPKYVQDSVIGLEKPDPDRDEIQLDFEPRLGSLFRAARRSQVNVAMWKGDGVSIPGVNLSNFHNVIVPVIKIEDYIEMDDTTLEFIKRDLVNMEHMVRVFTIVGIITALLLGALVGLFCLYKSGRFHRQYAVSSQESTKNNQNVNGKTIT